MNDTLRTLMNHRSYRQYSQRPVEDSVLQTIIEAAQAAPSWINGQHTTVISVRDEERKRRLSELSGGQAHVAAAPVFLVFCMDFYRAKKAGELEGIAFEAERDVDALLTGAVDVGIAMEAAITAAESLGLGIIPIGGVRRNSAGVIELLKLPKYVFPVVGLCLGYPGTELPKQPRLPLASVWHQEAYDAEAAISGFRAMNEANRSLLRAQGAEEKDWTARVASFFAANPEYGDAKTTLPAQGYTCGNLKKGQE
ncbi:FMN reductase [Paenibacillus stellifer]|uniref:FMN reductase n=1 Tax=Paenibacillus stellifer TaxID=169760 RepID=A0A089N420_9BACL|nr:NADPH-dependent oxidoreductase [Paenibacillus stellifer]AIQ63449.1 FMN reductase [Paenibacillus stellifer]